MSVKRYQALRPRDREHVSVHLTPKMFEVLCWIVDGAAYTPGGGWPTTTILALERRGLATGGWMPKPTADGIAIVEANR